MDDFDCPYSDWYASRPVAADTLNSLVSGYQNCHLRPYNFPLLELFVRLALVKFLHPLIDVLQLTRNKRNFT